MVARGVRALVAAAALLGLAACGSAAASAAGGAGGAGGTEGAKAMPAGGAKTAPGGPLCAGEHAVDRVAVSGTAVSRDVALRGATQVRALATALCALPDMAAGRHCPAATGGSVRLVFAAGKQVFPAVSVQESGCHGVTGIGPTRSWSASGRFGQLLSEAVGGLGRLIPGAHPSSVPTGP